MKPIIGITADYIFEVKANYPNPMPMDLVAGNIATAVRQAGGTPIILPTAPEEAARSYADIIDGLILSGGYDVEPSFYGQDTRLLTGATCPERDVAELSLADEMIQKKKPVLGICRGLQIINSLFKGTLHQDLSYCQDTYLKHQQETPMKHPAHKISVNSESYLAGLIGEETAVNSLHHQIINEVGEGLDVVAHAKDGVIEAVECMDEGRSVLAVQWHPEDMFETDEFQMRLFRDLIERSK